MTDKEFIKAMTFLSIAFDKDLDSKQINIYYSYFKNENYDVIKNTFKRIIATRKFFPTVSDIKQELEIIKNPELENNAEEEWGKVLFAIRKYGSYGALEAMESFSPLTQTIVRSLGGFSELCFCGSLDFKRKDFIKMYNNMKSDIVRATMTDSSLRTNKESEIIDKYCSEQLRIEGGKK